MLHPRFQGQEHPRIPGRIRLANSGGDYTVDHNYPGQEGVFNQVEITCNGGKAKPGEGGFGADQACSEKSATQWLGGVGGFLAITGLIGGVVACLMENQVQRARRKEYAASTAPPPAGPSGLR